MPRVTAAQKIKQDAQEAHKKDLALIAERMHDLARRYGWCGTFTEEVKKLNNELTFPLGPSKPRTGSGSITLQVSISMEHVPIDEDDCLTDEVYDELCTRIMNAINDEAFACENADEDDVCDIRVSTKYDIEGDEVGLTPDED